MKSLVIVGLGPGSVAQLTQEARACLQAALGAGRLIMRTHIHPTVDGWPELAAAPSLDYQYDAGADFDEVYDRIAGAVLDAAARMGDGEALIYAVPGHPTIGEATVTRLRRRAPTAGVALRLIPGLSFVDSVTAALGVDVVAGGGGAGSQAPEGSAGLRVADALALGRIDPTIPLLVCQIYSRRTASHVKLTLGKHYPDDHGVTLVRAAGVPGQEQIVHRALFEIDRDGFVDHLTSLWVPPLAPLQARREPRTLQEVMARLRAPDGCPWDREQTHASLRKYLLEETYETLEALDAGDMAALEEELGDLLLQIVFHAQVAEEAGVFDLGDVVAGIVSKMIRRHPHVFGREAAGVGGESNPLWREAAGVGGESNPLWREAAGVSGESNPLWREAAGVGGESNPLWEGQAPDADTVLRNWEVLKRAERAAKAEKAEKLEPAPSMLDGVPLAMPALAHAQAVQDRAARVGFDWPGVAGVVEKVIEEARELAATTSADGRQEELGDLLFTVVNLARWLGVDAEEALRTANQKFRTRFTAMEAAARAAGKTLDEYDAAGLEALWEAAKRSLPAHTVYHERSDTF